VLAAPAVVALKSEYLTFPIADTAAVVGVVALCFGAALVALAQMLMTLATLGPQDRVA